MIWDGTDRAEAAPQIWERGDPREPEGPMCPFCGADMIVEQELRTDGGPGGCLLTALGIALLPVVIGAFLLLYLAARKKRTRVVTILSCPGCGYVEQID